MKTESEFLPQALSAAVLLLTYLIKMKENLSQNSQWTNEQEDEWNKSLNVLNSLPQWKPRI